MSGGLVLLGPEALAGRELIERLQAAGLDGDLTLIGHDEDVAVLESVGGRLRAATPDLAAALADARCVLTCVPPSVEQAQRLRAASSEVAVLDLTGTLGGDPLDAAAGGRLRPGILASPSAGALLGSEAVRAARRAGASGPAALVVLEPVSELGLEAVDEMHAQAVALLNFRPLPVEVLSSQAVHDVASPGVGGSDREARLRAEIAGLLAEDGGPASVLRVQAGVFHGVALAVRCEIVAQRWREALGQGGRLRLAEDPALATPVGAVRAGEAFVGRVEDDGAGGAWAWLAGDTLSHGSVGNAVALLEEQRGRAEA